MIAVVGDFTLINMDITNASLIGADKLFELGVFPNL